MENITVLLIDPYRAITNALVHVLKENGKFRVVGEVASKEQGLTVASVAHPRVILLNADMSFLKDATFIREIKKISSISKIVGLSSCRIPAYAKKIIREGASGYLTLNTSVDEFILALTEVSQGHIYLCRDIKDKLSNLLLEGDREKEPGIDLLSVRELAIADYIRRGFSSKEIAAVLNLSVKTVEVHRYNILKKLNLRNTAALVTFLHENSI